MIKKIRDFINRSISKGSKTKNTYYIELLEAPDGKECAICRLLVISIEKYIENLLHEFTMDSVSRREIRDSFGYCSKHTAQFIKVTENTNQRLSASIVAEDLANSFLKHCRKAVSGLSTRGIDSVNKNSSCPICTYYSKHEKLYISEFTKGIRKEEFLNKYRKNLNICIDHLKKVTRSIKDHSVLEKILEPMIAEIESIDLELKNFIMKFDHRSNDKITEGEAAAWIRLFNMINKK